MHRLPQMAGVTELRNNYPALLKKLRNGPVVLAQRSKPIAVVVSPEHWNAQADELARLRRIVEADRHFADVDAGHFLTQAEFDAQPAGS